MNAEEIAHRPDANPAVGPDTQSQSTTTPTLQPSDTYSLIDELSDGLPSPSVEQPEPLSEATAAAEPPFTAWHRRYLLDRA
ncbi:MAG: hypothetical protein ABIQ16_05670, partial [Polyangiaceae bacterium]